jgi:hypothetical protein
MSNSGLYTYIGCSLVDITATRVIRSQHTGDILRNQQRNWETVLQCMGLRTQALHIHEPTIHELDLDYANFGEFYSGVHKVWMWKWSIEASEVYDLPGEPMAGLLRDFEQVPVITGLTETAGFMLPIFHPHGAIKNIYFTSPRDL